MVRVLLMLFIGAIFLFLGRIFRHAAVWTARDRKHGDLLLALFFDFSSILFGLLGGGLWVCFAIELAERL